MPELSFKSLYWKISALFLIVLLLLGVAFNFLTLFSAEMYFQEGNQRLHREFASFIVEMMQPNARDTLEPGEIIHAFEEVQKMNPSVEVYLLDEDGKILFSSTPRDQLRLDRVDVEPIHKFLTAEGKEFTMGQDPRGTHKEKVFTAAPFSAGGKQIGYVYVILGGEEYDSALEFLQKNYILRLGLRTLLICLVAAAVIGLVSLAFLTRRLRQMTKVVMAFGDGNYSQRIPLSHDDEIGRAAQAFNRMADMIQRHVDELAAVDSLRRELIANVSHDLRTPLSSMQGYVETVMLKNGTLPENERKQYLQTILDGTTKLNKLVQELFELSKLDAKQTLPKPEPFSLTELVQDIVQKFAPQAAKQSITIETQFNRDLPFVFADIGMIERVLQNLLENAIKYTPSGGKVRILLEDDAGKLRVRITDNGCGIPASEMKNVFDRFYRSSRNRTTTDGVGLGLAIVKRILELHGEEITVESREGTGSTFTFPLPIHAH